MERECNITCPFFNKRNVNMHMETKNFLYIKIEWMQSFKTIDSPTTTHQHKKQTIRF